MTKGKIIKLIKREGETPLESLNRLRRRREFRSEKLTYAGRLDPLASGVLLVLSGKHCREKEKYLKLDKEYDLDILFGFSTDTGDILGIPKAQNKSLSQNSDLVWQKILKDFVGTLDQKYPAYSAKYWQQARAGKLDLDLIETKKVKIYKIKFLKQRRIGTKNLARQIVKKISRVGGDFRQEKILAGWSKILAECDGKKYQIISLRVSCSSGTCMRLLAERVGEKLGQKALAWRIHRGKIALKNKANLSTVK